MASSETSSQRKHDYVIAKMKRDEIEKRNEAAIRLAKQKQKQMEIDELEENKRKRLAEATLRELELLDAVSNGSQSETTASARSSRRNEKAVQDWLNTSLALRFHNEEKTSEPEATIALQNVLDRTTAKQWKIRTLKFQGILFQIIVEAITF